MSNPILVAALVVIAACVLALVAMLAVYPVVLFVRERRAASPWDCVAVGAWSPVDLSALVAGRELVDGPFERMLPDGRVQFYAYVRPAAA